MFDIGIIGAGPAGYTAAIRASQYGFKVVLFEANEIGGTCLNRGCIPTKALLHCTKVLSEAKNASKFGVNLENLTYDYPKMFERKNDTVQKIRKSLTQLIQSYGVEIINSEAQIKDANTIVSAGNEYSCKNIIIATGSKPRKISLNGDFEDDFVLDSDDILNCDNIPENILIVGSGAIGIEWARIFSELNKKVIMIEIAPNLIPLADIDVSNRIEKIFKRSRINYFTSTSIKEINGNKVVLSNEKEIEVDCILLATGRSPVLLFDEFASNIEADKFIKTDNNFKTSVDNIYAIGDVNGVLMLAHSAIHQAVEVIEHIKNKTDAHFDSDSVPSVIYGHPEIAWIGKREQDLVAENIEHKKSLFPVAALGKAQAEGDIEGFIKVIATDNEILGVHIVSNEASAMIQQFAIAIQNNLKPSDLSKVIFAHPTYSEGVFEAILGLDNLALHIPQQK